jgi:hypothetical protein
MLMDHSEAARDSISGRRPNPLLSGYPNLAGVGLVHSEKELHGGGFSGAVFAYEAVNTPWLNAQIDPVVGEHGAKPFCQLA